MTAKAVSSPVSILTQLHEQSAGFKFGEPQRLDERALSVVLPIIRETSVKRQYVTLPETDKVSIHDSGSISKMRASSVSTENVFIRSGSMFKGATQERVSVRSIVLFPGKTIDIEVRCIHQSRGISPNSKVTYGGISPISVDNAVYGAGFTARDQHTYWKNVSATSSLYTHTANNLNRPMRAMRSSRLGASVPIHFGAGRLNTNLSSSNSMMDSAVTDFADNAYAPSDDLSASLNEFAANFDDLLSKIKHTENQTGLALINEKGCQTIETFDVPLSWVALHQDAVKRVGSHVVNLDDTSVFQYKPENAVKAVQAVLALDWKTNLIYEHKQSNGEPHVSIHGITAKDFVGEVVEIDNRVMHLLILKSAA